ncbi:hypothetical protein [Chryseobacterium sp. PCH239]|nr:hypothetical protein [Chryseobacterium sp. PCH239]
MNSDTVKTFPMLIGVQNTKYIAYALVFISSIISAFYLDSEYALAFFMASILTYILIYFSDNKRDDAYFSFGVETCSALPFLFLVIMEYF